MNKKLLGSIVFVTFIFLAGLVVWRRTSPGACDVCVRGVCHALTVNVRRTGPDKKVCCPRCGVFYAAHHGNASVDWVTDFATGQKIDAEGAFYVIGSDVTLCHRPDAVRDDLHGTAAYPKFDRCLPSVLSFETREKAEAFLKEHGGTSLTFEQLKKTVLKKQA